MRLPQKIAECTTSGLTVEMRGRVHFQTSPASIVKSQTGLEKHSNQRMIPQDGVRKQPMKIVDTTVHIKIKYTH